MQRTFEILSDPWPRDDLDDDSLVEGWVTINGTHVFIGDDGSITKGPAGLIGSKPDGATATAEKPKDAPGAEAFTGSVPPWELKADAPARYPGDNAVYSPALKDANGNYALGLRIQGNKTGKPAGDEVNMYSFIPGKATPEQLSRLEGIMKDGSDHAQMHPGEIAYNENGQLVKIPGNNYWIRGNIDDIQGMQPQLSSAIEKEFGKGSSWSVMMTPETPSGKASEGTTTTHMRVVIPFEKDTPPNTVGTPIVNDADRDKIMSIMSGDSGRRVWQHTDFNGVHIGTQIPSSEKDYLNAAVRELGGAEDKSQHGPHQDAHNLGATRFIPKDVNIEDYPVKKMSEALREAFLDDDLSLEVRLALLETLFS